MNALIIVAMTNGLENAHKFLAIIKKIEYNEKSFAIGWNINTLINF